MTFPFDKYYVHTFQILTSYFADAAEVTHCKFLMFSSSLASSACLFYIPSICIFYYYSCKKKRKYVYILCIYVWTSSSKCRNVYTFSYDASMHKMRNSALYKRNVLNATVFKWWFRIIVKYIHHSWNWESVNYLSFHLLFSLFCIYYSEKSSSFQFPHGQCQVVPFFNIVYLILSFLPSS